MTEIFMMLSKSDNKARAPAFSEYSALRLNRPAAAKTGTTTDWRDNWTIGYTPELVTGVWVGNADNKPMERVSGITGAGPIWHDLMQEALKGKPIHDFTRPAGLIDLDVCATSGLLPTPFCPYTKREVFIAGTQPTQPDNLYKPVEMDVATGLPATADTPRDRIETRVFLMLPAEAREWARDNGIPQLVIDNVASPQPTALSEQPSANSPQPSTVRITRPDSGTVYRLTPQTPIETQRIPVQAIVADGVKLRSLTLLVDGQPLGEFTVSPARTFWRLQPGAHTITARLVDEQGQAFESEAVRIVVTHTCAYLDAHGGRAMPVMVQIRNMPDGVHRKLKARAAASGLSLSDYLLHVARRDAEQPSLEELWERIRSRTPAQAPIDGAELVRLGREQR